ncbi:MAG: alpha/beta hydrolase [Chloroflexi bacterium]|nr:alpha/beta hydrolase [Chloroflexota bacterium]
MPLDPQAQAVLDQTAALGLPPNHTVTPTEARANGKARPKAPGPEVAKVEDKNIPGPDGQIPVRVYTPDGGGPFPVLVWFHGGGWVVGDLDTSDGTARHLAVGADCVVVSVDYRLAPETQFPGPAEDCYAATQWVAQNAASIGGDPSRIAVGGDSAGGNLATVVCLMARDRQGPSLAHQLLVYPVTERDFYTPSYGENGDGYSLTRDSMRWYWMHYLVDNEDANNPYAAPMMAEDLSGLPPALVITAEYDPLRDEGEAYAHKLEAAGVPTHCTRYDGMMHGFFGASAVLDKGKQAIDEASRELRAAFAQVGVS